jgi:RNA polymerase sigma-70 factor (ECF subfamily)
VGRLVDTYVSAGAPRPADIEEAPLEAALVTLCARGRSTFPSFGLTDEEFVAHIARCGAPVEDGLTTIHAEDLYLACACLQGHGPGNDEALARLRDIGRPVLTRYLSRIPDAKAIADEIEQRLWDAVLVGTPPRLASYAGRGALGAWLGVTAQRLALMELRHEGVERRALNELAVHENVAAANPELLAIKERFRPEFQRALAAALQTLDARQRMLYRMHLIDGLTLESIAKAYRVHAVTVGRWLGAARKQVLDETKRQLRAELPLASDDFESLARLLASGLDVDISQALKSK